MTVKKPVEWHQELLYSVHYARALLKKLQDVYRNASELPGEQNHYKHCTNKGFTIASSSYYFIRSMMFDKFYMLHKLLQLMKYKRLETGNEWPHQQNEKRVK